MTKVLSAFARGWIIDIWQVFDSSFLRLWRIIECLICANRKILIILIIIICFVTTCCIWDTRSRSIEKLLRLFYCSQAELIYYLIFFVSANIILLVISYQISCNVKLIDHTQLCTSTMNLIIGQNKIILLSFRLWKFFIIIEYTSLGEIYMTL